MLAARDALDRLMEGNRRFVAGERRTDPAANGDLRAAMVAAQEPFAVVLGCSDSRVPPELVFDQGLGDLFVIRLAGNIVTAPATGSVEFAVELLGVRLVVVLGHTRCGAVTATLADLEQREVMRSPNLSSIVRNIRPSVEQFLETGVDYDLDDILREAMRANVRVSVDHLRQGSELLRRHADRHGLLIVGAEYALDTGVVDLLEVAE